MSAKALRRDYERFTMRPIDIAGSAIPEGWMGTRRTAALLDSPRWLETDVTVQLPAGYRAEIRPPMKIARDFAEYARRIRHPRPPAALFASFRGEVSRHRGEKLGRLSGPFGDDSGL